jgi:hypothetical protein
VAGILGGNEIDRGKRFACPWRQIIEIADRRGYNIQCAAHLAGIRIR